MFYLVVLALLGFPVLAIMWHIIRFIFSAGIFVAVLGFLVIYACCQGISESGNNNPPHKIKWHDATAKDFQ